jgi:hypothetical protein
MIGIAVFIDDNQRLLRSEKRIAETAGLAIREISTGERLRQHVEGIFSEARERGLPGDRIVFFIDNRMGEFAKALSDGHGDNVVYFDKYRSGLGQHGKHAGMAVAEWLVDTYSETEAGFHLNKTSSEDARTRAFSDAVHSVVVSNSSTVALAETPTKYPYGKVLLGIIQDLDLTSDEVGSFLRLSPSAKPKLNLLYSEPDHFDLDTLDWQEKVFITQELLLILQHDFDEFDRVRRWLTSPHVLLQGLTPRELIISGLISEIDTLRTIVRY